MEWNVGSITLVATSAVLWLNCSLLVFLFLHIRVKTKALSNTDPFNRIGEHVALPHVHAWVFLIFLSLLGPLTVALSLLSLFVWVVIEAACDIMAFVCKHIKRRADMIGASNG